MSKLDFMETLFPTHGLSAPSSEQRFWPTLFGGGMMSSAGVQVTAESAMRQATANACVRVLSETLAQLPVDVFERTGSGQRIEARNYQLTNVIGGLPNRWQTWFEWCEMMEGHLALRGNAYSLIVPGQWGAVTELWPLHPERVSVSRLENMRLLYTVTYQNGSQENFSQDEIFHLRGLSSDGIVGLSPIAMARDTLGLSIAAEGYGSKFFAGGVRPSGILKLPPGTKPQDAEKAQQTLIQKYSGPDGWNIPMALWGSIEWQELGMTNKDAEFMESMKRSDVEICKIWRMPPHMVGILDRSTNNNIEQQSLEFVLYTMLPWVRRWEEAISRQLITDPDRYYVKFNLRGLLRGDASTRATFYTQMVNAGLMCPNEVRELEDLDPYEGGEKFFMQGAMVPVDRLLNPPALPPPFAGPTSEEQQAQQDEAKAAAMEVGKALGQVEVCKTEIGVLSAKLADRDQSLADTAAQLRITLTNLESQSQHLAAVEDERNGLAMTAEERAREVAKLTADVEGLQSRVIGLVEQHERLTVDCQSAEAELAAVIVTRDALRDANRVALESNAGLLTACTGRMIAMEAEAMDRASRKRNFLAAVDEFYVEHAERFAGALTPIVEQRIVLGVKMPAAIDLVTSHIEVSRQAMLAAAECSADELVGRVSECVLEWPGRASDFVYPQAVED